MSDKHEESAAWRAFRDVVRKWAPVATLVALFVGAGVVQITPARVELNGYETALVVLAALAVVLALVLSVVLRELRRVKLETATLVPPTPRLPPIREVALDALEERLARRSTILNQLHLHGMRLVVKVDGEGPRLDAQMMWEFDGHNPTNQLIGELAMFVSGDNSVSWKDLKAEYFDLGADPDEAHPKMPVCVHESPHSKQLSLPFPNPGLLPKSEFKLRLYLTWQGMVTIGDDYWLLDMANFGRIVDEFSCELHYPRNSLKSAYLLEGAPGPDTWEVRYGALVDKDDEGDHVELIDRPGASNRVYVAVVEWND